MTEDDKELRQQLGHDWVTNGITENEEDRPIPIYGAPADCDIPSSKLRLYEIEGKCLVNSRCLSDGPFKIMK